MISFWNIRLILISRTIIVLHKFRTVYVKYTRVVTLELSTTFLKFMSAFRRVSLCHLSFKFFGLNSTELSTFTIQRTYFNVCQHVGLSANLHFNSLFSISAYLQFQICRLYNYTDSLDICYTLLCVQISRCMRITNASICTNVTRGSQYIVMHNTVPASLKYQNKLTS